MTTAYSYVRFSSPEQAKGDSLRRQTEAAADWAKRNNVHLDTSLTLHDLGKSAFRGQHHKDDKHALGAFIRLAEAGRVPPDSYLIIERLDRLTREDVNDALELFLRLKKLVRIVQLFPVEVIHDRRSNPMQLMMALVELMRGRDESEAKSHRVGAVRANERKLVREGKRAILTRKLPAWVKEQGGKLVLIPERAKVVKRIFQMAAGGYGTARIAKKLSEEGVPPFMAGSKWNQPYLHLLLTDRRAIGEFQLRRRAETRAHRGYADGEPIKGYFPAAVTEEEYLAAAAGIAQRRTLRGRTDKNVNVFSGLLFDAADGGPYVSRTVTERMRSGGIRRWRVLANIHYREKAGVACRTFPFATFERAILSKMREIDPAEVMGVKADGPDEVAVLAGRQARLEADIDKLGGMLLGGDSPKIEQMLRAAEAEMKAVTEQMAVARQQASKPLAEAWGEMKSLLEVLDAAPDQIDARLRLRGPLRRVVERIDLKVTPVGQNRVAEVAVRFHRDDEGQAVREYVILHRPRRGNGQGSRPGGWAVVSGDLYFTPTGRHHYDEERDVTTVLMISLVTVRLPTPAQMAAIPDDRLNPLPTT
jgi:DNA invertase Pin-like site-specific DNA recombinase